MCRREPIMRTTLKVVLGAMLLLLANADMVGATDFCIDVDNGGKTFVLPGKGVCTTTRGFGQGPVWLDGMACGSSDGVNITFSFVAYFNGTEFETNFFKLHRASLTTAVNGHICAGFSPGPVTMTC